MADGIGEVGRSLVKGGLDTRQIKRGGESDGGLAGVIGPDKSAGVDEVVLSEATEAALSNAEFDQAKVERIKQAIADGNYPLDARRIAESFASIESLITR
jgi:negative regulator of flagellin synthesis FlgM